MSEDATHGFADTVGAAFLRRRLQSRQLRAAGVRGLKGVSAGAAGLQIEFDPAASSFAQVPPWLAAHSSELAAAPAPPTAPSRVPRACGAILGCRPPRVARVRSRRCTCLSVAMQGARPA